MPDERPATLTAALAYARRGWPVFPCKPRSKEPATKNGVNDATTDEAVIRRWWQQDPERNVAIACGAPGPNVLDIDDMAKGHDALILVLRLNGPDVATARGRQFYLQGTSEGTITLGYGELRRKGSYIVAPPSIHPTGKEYVFITEPSGAPLPKLPDGIVSNTAVTAGVGDFEPVELIPHGQRHDALKDATVRFVRAGFVDQVSLEQMLRLFFEAHCDPNPPPRKDEFTSHAVWGAKSNIAARERAFADVDDKPAKGRKPKAVTGLEHPPRGDAPLKDHRAYVSVAGGWGDRIDVTAVVRAGQRPGDWLDVKLSNGQLIHFDRQEHVSTRGTWARLITLYTNGIANPVALNELDGQKVLRSLCILADAPTAVSEAEDLRDAVDTLIATCEEISDHDLATWDGRYDAIARCRARKRWDPFHDDDERRPVLLVNRDDGVRFLRAGELRAWLTHEGFRIDTGLLAGRMRMIDVTHVSLHGRESLRPDRESRATNHMVVYQLPPESVAK